MSQQSLQLSSVELRWKKQRKVDIEKVVGTADELTSFLELMLEV